MIKGVAILLAASTWLAAGAQSKLSSYVQLSGKVTDTGGVALSKATVRLTTVADTLTTLSDVDGNFVLSPVRLGRIQVRITMKGYLPFSQSYAISEGKSILTLKPITLRADYTELDPVIVSRLRPITIHDDTVSYNVAAFPVRDGSEVEDILKRLPGLEVDINGNVIIQGKPLTKVLVNGKEFFGSDVLLAIQNLPANVVDKLQIVDDYGDKARLTGVKAGESAKVLNIVLKPDKRNGKFGQAHAGTGDQGKYETHVFGNAFNGPRQLSADASISNNNPMGSNFATRAGFNYSDQWDPRWNGALNINRSSQAPQTAGSSVSTTYYPGQVLQQTAENFNSNYFGVNNINGKLTFKPTSYSTFRLILNGDIGQSNSHITSDFTELTQDTRYFQATTGNSLTTMQTANRLINSSLYYEWLSPKTRRRWSVESRLGYTATGQNEVAQSSATVTLGNTQENDTLHYITSSRSNNLILSLNTNYFVPVGSKAFLEIGYKLQSAISSNSILTRQSDSAAATTQTTDSVGDKMLLRGVTQDIHAGLTGRLNYVDFSALLTAEPGEQHGIVDGKAGLIGYHYLSILPYLDLDWNITKGKKLSFSYNRRPILPTVQELSPYTNVSNPQYPVTGNPNLVPAETYTISLHYEESRPLATQYFGYGGWIDYSETKHSIIQDITTPSDSAEVVQTTSWINAANTYALTGGYHLALPAIFRKRLRINYSGSLTELQTITLVNTVQSPTQSWSLSQTLHLLLLVPDLVESDLSGTYTRLHTSYAAGSSLPALSCTAELSWNSRIYFLRHWIWSEQLTQSYTSSGNRLETAPLIIASTIQRQFLPHNIATINLSGYNLLGQAVAASQSSSVATVVQARPVLTGRYYLVGFILKLQRFK